MFLADAATQSTHLTFFDWVIGILLVGGAVWAYQDHKKREEEADREFTDEKAKKYALDALMHFARQGDVCKDPVNMDDYWRAQPYWQWPRHLDRVKALFELYGAHPVKQEDGTILYKGSSWLLAKVDALAHAELHPHEPTTSITIGAGAVTQIGNNNTATGIMTRNTQVAKVVSEQQVVLDALVDLLKRFAAAPGAGQAERNEALALSREIPAAQSTQPESVPGLAHRARILTAKVAASASAVTAGLTPLVSLMNAILDTLQKAGLHL